MKRQQKNSHLLMACMCMAFMCGEALAQAPGIDELVARGEWREAALAAFRFAEDTSPRTIELPRSQAQVGLANEAIEAAMRREPGSRTWAFIEIGRYAPNMAKTERLALLKRAEEDALLSSKQRWMLPLISVRYLQLGSEKEARRVYQHCLQLAEAKPGEYRQLVETFAREKDLPIKPWITAPLAERLEKMPDAFHAAFAHLALSQLHQREGNAEAARKSLLRGFEITQDIGTADRRDTALRSLGETAIEMGELTLARRHASEERVAGALAKHAAQGGDYDKAMRMISGFNANLYVDHRIGTIWSITQEAVERKDLLTARHFLAVLPEWDWRRRALGLTGIARTEQERGNRQEALKAYDAALAPYLTGTRDSISDYDIATLAELADALLTMGENARARKVSDQLDKLIAAIRPTDHEDIIRSESLAAELCGKLHDYTCASLRILGAYDSMQHMLAATDASSAGSPEVSLARQWTAIGKALGSIGQSAATQLSASR